MRVAFIVKAVQKRRASIEQYILYRISTSARCFNIVGTIVSIWYIHYCSNSSLLQFCSKRDFRSEYRKKINMYILIRLDRFSLIAYVCSSPNIFVESLIYAKLHRDINRFCAQESQSRYLLYLLKKQWNVIMKSQPAMQYQMTYDKVTRWKSYLQSYIRLRNVNVLNYSVFKVAWIIFA